MKDSFKDICKKTFSDYVAYIDDYVAYLGDYVAYLGDYVACLAKTDLNNVKDSLSQWFPTAGPRKFLPVRKVFCKILIRNHNPCNL